MNDLHGMTQTMGDRIAAIGAQAGRAADSMIMTIHDAEMGTRVILRYMKIIVKGWQPAAKVPRAASRLAGRVGDDDGTSPSGLRRHGGTCFVAAPVRWPASNAALRPAFDPEQGRA